MNKKLIAMAVATGLAAPMVVNAAPTVYGQLQTEYVMYDRAAANADTTEMVDNGRGRIGMKGSHDLGGGLSAVYKAEYSTDTAENTGVGDRTTYIGLKGNFGQVTFGTQDTPYKSTNLDPFVTTVHQARGDRVASQSHWTNHGFIDQAIEYNNTFGNLSLGILYGAYSDDDDTDGNESEGGYSVGLTYADGPLKVIAAHSTDSSDDNAGTEDRTWNKLGAQFSTGPWTFTAQHEMEEGRGYVSGSAGEVDFSFLAASFKMGKNMIYARVGQADFDGANDNEHMALVVRHSFSKQVRAWVGYSTDDYDAGATTGSDLDILSAGMRVDF